MNIPFLSDSFLNDQLFNSFSSIINGGLIFINVSNDITIGESIQHMEPFGFIRINNAIIQMQPQSSEKFHIFGNYRLIFLGDHFYSSQAEYSETGFSIPIYPIIFWILALVSFILFNFYINNKIYNFELNEKFIKIGFLIFHIISIFIVFLLIDSEISYKFGISFFSELSSNGLTMVSAIFGGIQLLFWVIWYLGVALPLGYIIIKITEYLGFDKNYKHLFKGAALYSIWPMTAIYATMFINFVLLFFNPLQSVI